MGKLVAFWSPYIGQAKVTSTICAIAGAMGMQYPEMSVALSYTVPGMTELEEKLDCQNRQEEKKEVYRNFGIHALKLNYMQSILTSEKIRRCGIPLLMKSLYLYPYMENEKDELAFRILSEYLKKGHDAVFLDVESGRGEYSGRFLEAADIVVLVMPQDPKYWQQFVTEGTECLAGKKPVVILGGTLEKAKYNARYYSKKREWNIPGIIAGTVPMNHGFLDAMSEGKTLHFFLKNQLVIKKEENYEFIFQVKKTAENIRKSLFLS